MEVKYVRDHLSIKSFSDIILPKLTILIGVNGSGKSHFLQAIKEKAITIDEVILSSELTSDIVLIENGSIASSDISSSQETLIGGPRNAMIFTNTGPEDQYKKRMKLILGANYPRYRRIFLKDFENLVVNKSGLVTSDIFQGVDIWSLTEGELHIYLEDLGGKISNSDLSKIFSDVRERILNPEIYRPNRQFTQYFNDFEPDNWFFVTNTCDVISRTGKGPLEITGEDILEKDSWGEFNIFNPKIYLVFSAYRDAHSRNVLARSAAKENSDVKFLSNEQFIDKFGEPPWVQITNILRMFGLPYICSAPTWDLDIPVQLTLERIQDKTIVKYGLLSSGEKTLVLFAISIFKFDRLRLNISMPRILLLDEIDSSLHPEMAFRWLRIIKSELVENLGIKIIITTHSPTTVAFADEYSIFLMEQGVSGPTKINRQQAINSLTFGLPSLSVDFDGRRQVFVESRTDAKSYQTISDIFKTNLKLTRTLTFVSTGPNTGKQEVNTGSSIVKHLVKQLEDNGNKSIFGILDWDKRNISSDRIKVLGEGSHYSLENILLNPLLIAALMIRCKLAGFDTSIKVVDLANLDLSQAQTLADYVQKSIDYPTETSNETADFYFSGGLIVQVRKDYMMCSGHELEKAIVNKFPALNRFHPTTRGSLNEAVIEYVLCDWPDFIPSLIADLLYNISSQELD